MSTPPPDRVRFPRNDSHRFYSCMACSNHMLNVPLNDPHAVAETSLTVEISSFSFLYELWKVIICNARQIVNVRFDSPENRMFRNGVAVVNVYCDQCNERVGEKLITRGLSYHEPILLKRNCLLYWDGAFTVYADTLQLADVDND